MAKQVVKTLLITNIRTVLFIKNTRTSVYQKHLLVRARQPSSGPSLQLLSSSGFFLPPLHFSRKVVH